MDIARASDALDAAALPSTFREKDVVDTAPGTVDLCLAALEAFLPRDRPLVVVDYSAGDGAWKRGIVRRGWNAHVHQYDLCPRAEGITRSDWFDVAPFPADLIGSRPLANER